MLTLSWAAKKVVGRKVEFKSVALLPGTQFQRKQISIYISKVDDFDKFLTFLLKKKEKKLFQF